MKIFVTTEALHAAGRNAGEWVDLAYAKSAEALVDRCSWLKQNPADRLMYAHKADELICTDRVFPFGYLIEADDELLNKCISSLGRLTSEPTLYAAKVDAYALALSKHKGMSRCLQITEFDIDDVARSFVGYFESDIDFAKREAALDENGAADLGMWPYTCIDWKIAADILMSGETGDTYIVHNKHYFRVYE